VIKFYCPQTAKGETSTVYDSSDPVQTPLALTANEKVERTAQTLYVVGRLKSDVSFGGGMASVQEVAAAAAAIRRNGARHIYFTGRVAAQEDMLRAAGVQTFLDEGSDALATLNAAYDILRQKDR